ncbi:MAG: hypothetical protein HOH43_24625, partial [Candidatus Latescibacteria bacterium]|nr:hypothetical protein [Candidatus Latescibacterota bacterium]
MKKERNRRYRRSLPQLVLLGFVYPLALLCACSGPTKFKFAAAADLPNPPNQPIRLWVSGVTDLSGSYQEQMDFHDLAPDLSVRIAEELAPEKFLFNEDGFKHRITNPFSVVTDSSQADMHLIVGIVGFGYERRRTMGQKLTGFLAFGVLSLLASDKPQGYVAATCQLRQPSSTSVEYEFDVLAVSTTSGQRG